MADKTDNVDNSEDKPTVFLGGEVQTDWREDLIDAHDALNLIDPQDDDWVPEENIYEEVADMLGSDEVVFKEGGEGTEREKELLDTLGVPYSEFDSEKELDDYLYALEEVSDEAEAMVTLELDAGDTVNIEGIPVELKEDVEVETAEGNAELIEEGRFGPFEEIEESLGEPLDLTASIKTALSYSSGCLMAPVPEELAQVILKEVAPKIPMDDLNVDEDNMLHGIETDSHITVLYGIEPTDENIANIQDYFTESITIRITGEVDYFDNEDASVAILKVDSPELEELHYSLRESMDNKQRDGDYVPHVTIAYLKPGARLDVEEVESFEWTISRLDFGAKDGSEEEVYVKGQEPEKSVELVAAIKKQAWDEEGYAGSEPSEIFFDNKDKFFGNLGDNEDYNDFSSWRGNFFGLPHVRKRIVDMMDANNIDESTTNVSIVEKSEDGAHHDAGSVDINDARPGKETMDYVTRTLVDVNVPRLTDDDN